VDVTASEEDKIHGYEKMDAGRGRWVRRLVQILLFMQPRKRPWQ